MLQLHATKTRLYKLVCSLESLPPMGRTQVRKTYRTASYWMEWTDSTGLWCKAYFSPCAGKPLLTIMKREPGGPEVSYKTYPLTLEDLRERGMVREMGAVVFPRKTCYGRGRSIEGNHFILHHRIFGFILPDFYFFLR